MACVCIYDADGDKLLSQYRAVYIALREPEKWRSAGTVLFTDGPFRRDIYSISSMSDEVVECPEWYDGVHTWEVALEESVESPGVYRLVNPYTCAESAVNSGTFSYRQNGNMFEKKYEVDNSGNDYYYIFDVRNPRAPWAYMTPTGVSVDGRPDYYEWNTGVIHSNQAEEDVTKFESGDLGYDTEGRIYTMEPNNDFEIIFPGYIDYTMTADKKYTGIEVSHLGEGVAEIRYTLLSAGQRAALELKLPPSITGVESVEVNNDAQNAPAEYFDLGGRRVMNPSTGIYIVRRGSSVTKEAVR